MRSRSCEQEKSQFVDTSNISDYSVINLKGEGDFHPRIIWTRQQMRIPNYLSFKFLLRTCVMIRKKRNLTE